MMTGPASLNETRSAWILMCVQLVGIRLRSARRMKLGIYSDGMRYKSRIIHDGMLFANKVARNKLVRTSFPTLHSCGQYIRSEHI
jgi:hypothetical protein